jgi:lipopolysaccharide export LptBFGC system permease protein LptF
MKDKYRLGDYDEGYEYNRPASKYTRDWATLEEMETAARWRKWFAAFLSVLAVAVVSIVAHFSTALGLTLTVLCGLAWAVLGSERFINWNKQRKQRQAARR